MRKSGSSSVSTPFKVTSLASASAAYARAAELRARADALTKLADEKLGISALTSEADEILQRADVWVVKNRKPGDSIDGDFGKFTLVAPQKVVYDVDKLRKLLPQNVFVKVIITEVSKDLLEQEAKAAGIDIETIKKAAALESAGKAYVKKTWRDPGKAKVGEAEADKLRELLG